MIYLDNAATTKLNDEVKSTLFSLYDNFYMNANSPYLPANNIHNLQEQARTNIKEMLGISKEKLIFTSSGSEANNMIIKGVCNRYLNRKKHIITSTIEHSSVFETIKSYENSDFEITYLTPNAVGVITNDEILKAIKDNTILISIMKVNSEIGSINNLEDIYLDIKAINEEIVIHSDCVQALGKVRIEFDKLDCASFSAHKINGLKGSGLVYLKQNTNILPLINGGEQEYGLRAGTSNYHFNIVFAKTLRLYLEKKQEVDVEKRFNHIYDLLLSDPRIRVNTPRVNVSMFIINFSICNYKPEVILNALAQEEIYVSTKSACSTKTLTSRVLSQMPIDNKYKNSSMRISFDLDTSIEMLDEFYMKLKNILEKVVSN